MIPLQPELSTELTNSPRYLHHKSNSQIKIESRHMLFFVSLITIILLTINLSFRFISAGIEA
ncbi:hypothetical protein JCM18903_183 [Psychrobacter sp. JCM 18903]|nr:hypothetical protein JCM18903_183 [Psychrobacter sp. JCM 18903]